MPQNNGNRKPKTSQTPQNRNRVSKSNEELRREHRAARRRQQRMRRRIFYVALSLIVIIVGIVLSLTVFFNITKIEVEGNTIYTEKEIIAASGVDIGDNLFLVARDSVRTSISEELPFAGNVEFSNKLPGTLKIKVYDTSVRCAIETKDGYILINENGKVLGTVDTLEELYENAVYLGQYKGVAKGNTPEEKTTEQTSEKTTEKTTEQTSENTTEKTAEQPSEKTTEKTTEKPSEKVTEKAEEKPSEPAEKNMAAKYVLSSDEVIILKGVEVGEATPGQTLVVKKEKTMELYQEIMASLKTNKINGIDEINLSDSFAVTLMYQERIEILLGSVSNLDNKLALCKEILLKQDEISPYQKGTVDLTIDKKAYFSPYSEQTTIPQTTEPVTAEGESTTGEGTSGTTSNVNSESTSEKTTQKTTEKQE